MRGDPKNSRESERRPRKGQRILKDAQRRPKGQEEPQRRPEITKGGPGKGRENESRQRRKRGGEEVQRRSERN